ncbi:MAG: tyrosinase family protein [Marinomonas sp.]
MSGIGATGALLGAPINLAAQTTRVRRNIADPSSSGQDIQALRSAISNMRSRNDSLSLETQRQIHQIYVGQHGTWRFLPWHRRQLAAFESIVSALSGKADFALPYWDYQQTPNLPSWLFDDPVFGASSRNASALTDIAARRWGWETRVARVFQDPFTVFAGSPARAGSVEAYGHNLVHGAIGGDMGRPSSAPLDPLFWMHHANVDRVWTTWHDATSPSYLHSFQNEVIDGFVGPSGSLPPVFAGQIIDAAALGYTYDKPYPFPVFNTSPGLASPGKKRVESSRDSWFVPSPVGGQRTAEIELPSSLLQNLRGDSEGLLDLDARGEIRLGLMGLAGKVIKLIARAPNGGRSGLPDPSPVTLLASYAYVHEPEDDQHRTHQEHGIGFRFQNELVNLIGTSKGPVILTASTIGVDDQELESPPPILKLSASFELIGHELQDVEP